MAGEEVLRSLIGLNVDTIIISGGEPLLQQRRLIGLVQALLREDVRVEFETNGTIAPRQELVREGIRYNVSPKLSNSGDPVNRRIKPAALIALRNTPDVAFKFVCKESSDLVEVADLAEELALHPIWIMPCGEYPLVMIDTLRDLADHVVSHGWYLGVRLHTLLWGNERGR